MHKEDVLRSVPVENTRRYTVIVEPGEDGVYIATAPSVPGVVEQGESVEEAVGRFKEALAFHLESLELEGQEIPPSDAPEREVRNIEPVI